MIPRLFDLLYLLLLLVFAPWLLYQAIRAGKYPVGLKHKLFGAVPRRLSNRPCIWFHAVSVGEILMLRRIVRALTELRPDVELVISSTTGTGMELAREHFGSHTLVYFPFDFSWAVSRALARVRPDVVALAELELWPNFITAAHRAGVRLAVINGRMSPRSHRGYRRIRPIMERLLRQIDTFAVQTPEYAERFVEIGAPPGRVAVTGSVKYDGIESDRNNPTTATLRNLFTIRTGDIVWVAGSTSEPEEQIVLEAYGRLRVQQPELRLVLVPRHRERFDEVSGLVAARGFTLCRRSQIGPPGGAARPADTPGMSSAVQVAVPAACSDHAMEASKAGSGPGASSPGSDAPIILVDTLGELSAAWGLADIAFVGGSFAPRGGQNMIEPAGYGAAIVLGPGTWNFQDTVNHLLACGGAIQLSDSTELVSAVGTLAADASLRTRLGSSARHFVLSQHGATARTVALLVQMLESNAPCSLSVGRPVEQAA